MLFGLFRHKYSIVIEGKKVKVFNLKEMDKHDKRLDRNSAKLFPTKHKGDMRYVVRFGFKDSSKVMHFDLPAKYAQLLKQ